MKIICVPGHLTEPIRKSTQKAPCMLCERGKHGGVQYLSPAATSDLLLLFGFFLSNQRQLPRDSIVHI